MVRINESPADGPRSMAAARIVSEALLCDVLLSPITKSPSRLLSSLLHGTARHGTLQRFGTSVDLAYRLA